MRIFGKPHIFGEPMGTGSGGASAPTLAEQILALSPTHWWNAEAGVYSDTGLTVPITPDGAVAAWGDQVGSVNPIQATAANKPTYRASVAALNNKPALQFDNGDYLLATIAAALVGNINLFNIALVFSTAETETNNVIYTEWNTPDTDTLLLLRTNTSLAGQMGAFHRSDAGGTAAQADSADIDINDGLAKVVILRRTAANAYSLRVNGAQVATSTVSIGTFSGNRLTFGSFGAGASGTFFTGHLAQIILFDADVYADVETILNSHYNI